MLEHELRDLWTGGRALVMCFAFSVLLSVIAYLVATNTDLNFLEQREAVNLTLQVATRGRRPARPARGGDAISGERERGTLETLLLTPAPRRQIATGKLLAALSLWLAAFASPSPTSGCSGAASESLAMRSPPALVVGTLLAVFLASLGILISVFAGSNRFSLALSLFVLLALFAPTQLPTGARAGLGRRPAPAHRPAHRGRALRRQDRRRRPLLERGCLMARLTGRRGRGARRPGTACGGALPAAARECLGMSRRRIALVLLALPVLALDPVAAADAAGAGGLSATVARTQISTELGRTFVVRSTISNHGTAGAGA